MLFLLAHNVLSTFSQKIAFDLFIICIMIFINNQIICIQSCHNLPRYLSQLTSVIGEL